jgi:LPS-assembly protein
MSHYRNAFQKEEPRRDQTRVGALHATRVRRRPELYRARAAGQKTSAETFIAARTFTLKVFRPMRTRVCICTMLLAFCHVRMNAQALTMRLPPARSGIHLILLATAKAQSTAPTTSSRNSAAPAPSPTSNATLTADANLPDAPQSATDNLPVAAPIPAPLAGVPVTIHASQQERRGDTYDLRGGVEIDYEDYVILADHATYNTATGEVTADGHLQVTGGPDHEDFAADHGTINLNQQTGHFYDVIGSVGVIHTASPASAYIPKIFGLPPTSNRSLYTSTNPFLIGAKELIKKGPESYELIGGSMTSCRLPKPDWRILAPQIIVDNGTAKARNADFQVLNRPVLFLPYVTHGVDTAARQSGFLIPSLEVGSSIKGTVVGEQYYWVINRSADLLVGFQYYSLRGWEQNAEFRYKGLGHDFVHGMYNGVEDRGLAPDYVNQGGQDTIVTARHDTTPYTRYVINAEYLSSYVYRQVFAPNYSQAVSSEVKSWAFLTHEINGFASSFDAERYEKFASDTSGDEIRILHLPRIEFDAGDHDLGNTGVFAGGTASLGFLARSEPYYQSHHVGRFDLFPHITAPWIADGWTIRPTLGVRETGYSHSQMLGPVPSNEPPPPAGALSGQDAVPTAMNAAINRAAVEGDLQILPPVLERDFDGPYLANHFGVALRHTIEPEINYRYVAGVSNFNQIPRFDATDIYSDTNEVEYGLTQRLFLKRLHPTPCGKDDLAAEQLQPGSHTCGEVSRQWLSWFVGQKYFIDPTFGNAVISGRRNIFTTTLDFSGVDYMTAPRDLSPVVSRLRLEPSSNTDLEWDADYDTKAGRWAGSNVFADYRHGNFFSGLGHSLLNAVGETPEPPTQPANVVNYNQMQVLLGYGAITKPGFSAAARGDLSLEGRALEYGGIQATYNRNCCGLTVEVQRFALGTVRNETSTTFNLTLSGVAAVGSLVRAERLF